MKCTTRNSISFNTHIIADIDRKVKESIGRCFTDDTRVSKVIASEDKGKMQYNSYLKYYWEAENLIEVSTEKCRQMHHSSTVATPFKRPIGK